VDTLLGDASKAREKLAWAPEVSFEQLVAEMVETDMELARRDAHLAGAGYKVYRYRE
jgi:GDPmannose 4,6-dehydratase